MPNSPWAWKREDAQKGGTFGRPREKREREKKRGRGALLRWHGDVVQVPRNFRRDLSK